MKETWAKKYYSWRGKCGAYAKHKGIDKNLKRMNSIRLHYWELYCLSTFGRVIKEP